MRRISSRRWMTAAFAIGLLAVSASLARADHKDPFRLACELVSNSDHLSRDIQAYFHCVPNYPHLVNAATDIQVHAYEVRGMLQAGFPACKIRECVDGIERDADRLEDCLEDISYRRHRIPRDAYRHAVKLADAIEDGADDLGDELKRYGRGVCPCPKPVHRHEQPVLILPQPTPEPPAPSRRPNTYRGHRHQAPIARPAVRSNIFSPSRQAPQRVRTMRASESVGLQIGPFRIVSSHSRDHHDH